MTAKTTPGKLRIELVQHDVGQQRRPPFAILAGSSITDSPTSAIKGDVGLSPSGWVAGLTCAEVTGTIYSVDASGPLPCRVTNPGLLTTAKNDLTAAYTNAAGRGLGTTVATELGGQTLIPGVYSSLSTTFGITAGAGALRLNGRGDPNAVFIFEMNSGATGLTVGPGSTVRLINGAQACNVFWRLNTATIDTTAVFKGTIPETCPPLELDSENEPAVIAQLVPDPNGQLESA